MDEKPKDGILGAPVPMVGVQGEELAKEIEALIEWSEDRDLSLVIAAMVIMSYSMATGEMLGPEEAQEVLNEFVLWVAQDGGQVN